MKRLVGVFLTATLVAAAPPAPAATPAAPAEPQSTALSSGTTAACDATALKLAEPYETVRVGALALAIDTILGGPGSCVGSASSESPNVRVELQIKNDVAGVRIWALHEGFATVHVVAKNGAPIGDVRVSVYPREFHSHKGH